MKRFWCTTALLSVCTFIGHAGHCAGEEPDPHAARHSATIQRAKQDVDSQAGAVSAGTLVQLGDAFLRAGQYDEAVKQFEAAIQTSPESEPYLWQHGIALFFAGRFDDAKRLFEKHRTVNPHDVENAAWHFLCVAKADDVTKARQILLPAPGDSRVPMEEVLQRLHGGDFGPIQAAVDKTQNTQMHRNASFYGDLYIGLIADAEGDLEMAYEYLTKAAKTKMTHYMADVARVYAVTLASRR